MALTIKNPETVALARTLALRTGMTQTGAITSALRQALADAETTTRTQRVNEILHHIWAAQSPDQTRRVSSSEDAFYDERGLPA